MLRSVIGAEFREVADGERDGAPVKIMVAARTYETDPEDLWDALTNAERIPRWFSPVTGDFKLGGRYQIQGNAEGTILRCEPAKVLDITWEFAGGMSWVVVTLAPDGEGTKLTLEHVMLARDMEHEHWQKYGPAAVGVGWDLSFLGLGLHLANGGEEKLAEQDPAWMATEEAKTFMLGSAAAWGDAHIASGETPETARRMADNTAKFYTGG
jgi:uncharacterized protein YndB with AHSA1/START domain